MLPNPIDCVDFGPQESHILFFSDFCTTLLFARVKCAAQDNQSDEQREYDLRP